ncbi:DODA-type extradiol aromatic ring-opening family dioxygenase [Acinetobacter pragensis]|uniref:Extradiol ring-cleavage dioxygenase class III enzyme subunit B domain-containing protein n=1 Tax=Acinetobacter pragensis TaxID=1806892 RepID=A0A151Y3Z2_9GAMM|nr:hypothetical protein [Acinetobacter pragensis]KYQ72738.1 hypothetical protein AZH43_07725 [Acinetobacter pragensis]
MAEICFAAAMSHTAQMHRSRDALPEAQDKDIYPAIDQLADSLKASKLDVLIILYGDHYAYFTPKNMPALCVGIADQYQTFGDGGVPIMTLPGNKKLSLQLTKDLIDQGFDMAWSNSLSPDHGTASPIYLMDAQEIPIIPIRLNSIAPPLISMERSHHLGQAIAHVVKNWDENLRVGILGTGGLSHFLPIPDPLQPSTPEEEEMAELISEGSNAKRLSELIIKRVNEVRNSDQGSTAINAEFDENFLKHLEDGNVEPLLKMTSEYIAERAGNGGQEVRNWIAVSGAVGDKGMSILSYQPAAPWLTGIALGEFKLA